MAIVTTLPAAIEALDLFGTAVFALTGALRAMSKKLDLMGAIVLAVVTAMGGGMMRDALIGRHPPAAFDSSLRPGLERSRASLTAASSSFALDPSAAAWWVRPIAFRTRDRHENASLHVGS